MGDVCAADTRRKEIGQARREKTRMKLLASAARVIAQRGEEKATIDDFIQAAGVARGTFYNYYSTRNELLEDLWTGIGRDPFRAISDACATIEDPAERLVTQARMVLTCAASNPTWGWLVYALSVDADTINSDLLAYPRPDLIAGLDGGRFSFDDIDSANDLVVGGVRRALRAKLSEQRSEHYGEALGTMLLRALGLETDEAARLASKPLLDMQVA
ncbi:MAG TPA: TetR/AcrR family transcriptional regulator [Sphingomicrobium sp.]|nr:TetR/AcrR family transcriptional regulator [Sphingomicrobium sp.]